MDLHPENLKSSRIHTHTHRVRDRKTNEKANNLKVMAKDISMLADLIRIKYIEFT